VRERYEDYLKAIYIISKQNKGGWVSNSEISNFLKINPSSVTDMLYKLKSQKLINWRPRKSLRLTNLGKERAIKTIEKYNYLKGFFLNVLKIKDSTLLDELCCGIEHHITYEISKSLKNLLMHSN
jgi:Mn-dependent DtxR family transcriptional regulator